MKMRNLLPRKKKTGKNKLGEKKYKFVQEDEGGEKNYIKRRY